jgi:hypothetical protein
LTLDILTSYNIGLRDAPFLLSQSYEKGAWYFAKCILIFCKASLHEIMFCYGTT